MRPGIRGKTVLSVLLLLIFTEAIFSSAIAADGLKKMVAVSRFENKTSCYTSEEWYEIGDGLADQLIDSLVNSEAFIVLERQTLADVVGEQDLTTTGHFALSDSARMGELSSAQILVKGTVTEFDPGASGSSVAVGFGPAKVGGKVRSIHVGMIVRLIDTSTGQVVASRRIEQKARSKKAKADLDIEGVDFGSETFRKTPIGEAVQMAMNKAVEFIAAKLNDVAFQGKILKVRDTDILVSASKETGVREGDVFTVYSIGEKLIDNETGRVVAVEEDDIGKIRITKVKAQYSEAVPVGDLDGVKQGDVIRSD